MTAVIAFTRSEPDLSWQDHALCAHVDTESFFPEKGGSTREAKRTCARCTVAAECLTYALTNNETFGIWGGLSAVECRHLKATHPCGDCGDTFTTPGGRDRHTTLIHHPPKNPVTCPTCGRTFAHNGAMFAHTQTHQNDDLEDNTVAARVEHLTTPSRAKAAARARSKNTTTTTITTKTGPTP